MSETRSPETAKPKRHIPTLDGWRAIALPVVLWCHAAAGLYSRHDYFALSLPRYGTFALDTFFGLSGLLICKLLLEEQDRFGSISLRGFYVRRCFRILLPCFAFTMIVLSLGLVRNGWELASCFLFFRNYLPAHLSGHYTAHLWSLAVEEHFYLILPAFLLVVTRQRAPAFCALAAICCAAWRFFDLHFHLLAGVLPADVQPGSRTDLRFDSFLWGCVAAFALHHPRSADWMRKHYKLPFWIGVFLAGLACVEWQPPLVAAWTAILIPIMLLGPLLHPDWAVSRFLDLPPMRYVGRISYSIYLWQQVFLIPTWETPNPLLGFWQTLPASCLAIAVCGLTGYYLMERPLTHLGHRLSRRGTSRSAPVPARQTPVLETAT